MWEYWTFREREHASTLRSPCLSCLLPSMFALHGLEEMSPGLYEGLISIEHRLLTVYILGSKITLL